MYFLAGVLDFLQMQSHNKPGYAFRKGALCWAARMISLALVYTGLYLNGPFAYLVIIVSVLLYILTYDLNIFLQASIIYLTIAAGFGLESSHRLMFDAVKTNDVLAKLVSMFIVLVLWYTLVLLRLPRTKEIPRNGDVRFTTNNQVDRPSKFSIVCVAAIYLFIAIPDWNLSGLLIFAASSLLLVGLTLSKAGESKQIMFSLLGAVALILGKVQIMSYLTNNQRPLSLDTVSSSDPADWQLQVFFLLGIAFMHIYGLRMNRILKKQIK